MSNAIPIHCDWMVRNDAPHVCAIDRMSFDEPWDYYALCRALSDRNAYGRVAQTIKPGGRGVVIGYLVYELHEHRADILRLAVHPAFRRAQVASQLVADLVLRQIGDQRPVVRVDVEERNLEAHLFFRDLCFKAVQVMRHSEQYRFELRSPAAGSINVDDNGLLWAEGE